MIGRIGKTLGALSLAVAAVLVAPTSAQAYTTNGEQCPVNGYAAVDYFNAVLAAVLAGEFKHQRDQDNMVDKVDAAWSKVQLGKWPDARMKLENVQDTADALAGALKPKLKSASAIDAAVVSALTNCVP